MEEKFARYVNKLHPSYETLLKQRPVIDGRPPVRMPKQGVYLFSENDKPLYVGRSNDIRARYFGHCRPSSTHFSASFAFRIAREEAGIQKASYKSDSESRKGLLQNPDFAAAFTDAKKRIRSMEFRYVEEKNAKRQTLLELYCAIVLETPYNRFNTH